MTMAQKDLSYALQIFIQSETVWHDGTATARIEEVISLIRFNKSRKPVFTRTNQSAHQIFTEDGYSRFHRLSFFFCPSISK
jgi:hypothetical protein